MFSLILGTFPKAFSQAVTSQGHFPKRQLPKGIFPRGNFPNEGKLPFGKWSFGKMYIWEVAAWEIALLGSCHLGNFHLTLENAFGKEPNTFSFRLMKKICLIIKYQKNISRTVFFCPIGFRFFFSLQS